MSDEEKDLQESDFDLGDSEDLADFVDLSDLADLENANNQDIFGNLGDLTDLGEIPDLSAAMDFSDFGSEESSEMPELDLSDIGGDISELEEVDIPDISDIPDVSDGAESDFTEFSDLNVDDLVEADISDLSEMDLSDELPDTADAGNDDILDFSDMEMPTMEEETVAMSDGGLADMEDADIPDLSDIALEEIQDEEIPNLDEIELAFDQSEAAADILDSSTEDTEFMGGTEETADLSDFSDIGMSNLGEIDGIPILSDLDVAEAEQGSMDDMMDMGGDMMEESTIGMEEQVMADATDTNSDFSITEDGLLGDLDISFDNPVTESEASPAEGGGSGINSMLDGLLGNLDMGSFSDNTGDAAMQGSSADMLGLDEKSYENIDDGGAGLDMSMLPPEDQKEKKPGFFKKIFGNVVTDEIAEAERQAAEQEAEEAEKKALEAQQAAEAKAAAKEQKKAEKEAKAAAKKKEKEEKKAQKEAEKAEKKAREEAEAAEVEIVGKLNKVGVSIIIVCTVLFLACEIMGTKFFNYARIKKEASNYFEMGKYTEAYKSAIGTDMKEKDSEEYDKIRTVMRVQQSINAYQNYARVKYYPEALDALLRGLKRYDANIEHGIELEVDKDMMACRKQILSILKTEFKMSESDAYAIISLDKSKYQNKVIKIGVKKARS